MADVDGSCDPNEDGDGFHNVSLRAEEFCEFCVLVQSICSSVLISSVNAGFDFDDADVFSGVLGVFVGLH